MIDSNPGVVFEGQGLGSSLWGHLQLEPCSHYYHYSPRISLGVLCFQARYPCRLGHHGGPNLLVHLEVEPDKGLLPERLQLSTLKCQNKSVQAVPFHHRTIPCHGYKLFLGDRSQGCANPLLRVYTNISLLLRNYPFRGLCFKEMQWKPPKTRLYTLKTNPQDPSFSPASKTLRSETENASLDVSHRGPALAQEPAHPLLLHLRPNGSN